MPGSIFSLRALGIPPGARHAFYWVGYLRYRSVEMSRIVVALLLACPMAWAHGGAFRPPPGRTPGDPTGGGGPRATTAGGGSGRGVPTWEAWWYLNRDPYLRIRERILEREVITGVHEREDFFDRRAVREKVLLPVMLEALEDQETAVRGAAAIACGKFRALSAVPTLLAMFKEDDVREVREASLLGLLLMRDPGLVPFFRGLALDGDEERNFRGVAVLALGLVDDAGFLADLLDRKAKLKGSATTIRDVRSCAALALGSLGRPDALGPLVAVAVDRLDEDQVRGYAAAALGRLRTPLGAPEVVRLLKDDDGCQVARCGAAIAAGALIEPSQENMVDLMGKKAARDRNGAVRALLALSLGRIGGERAATHLVAAMGKADAELRGFYYLGLGLSGHPDAGPILLQTFGRLKNFSHRSACALGLGLAGHVEAAPLLREELARRHPGFVPHGMIALALLDDREAIPLVQEILRDDKTPSVRREGAIALALLRRTAAVPELVKLFEETKSRFARGSIVSALGVVGTDKAVLPLLVIRREP